jgi:HK97 gp10 family phage protein
MNFRASSTFKPVDLVRIQQTFVPKIVAAVTEGCTAVVEEAQTIVPVDTGELKDSIHTASVQLEGTVVSGTVTADAPHAEFVEYGTGVRGDGTYPYELPADWHYDYKGQGWKGHASQAFMRPALDTARAEILAAYEKQGFKVG